jgi:5-methylcytosine-specific restriction enzyme subunit McrC
VALVTVQVFEHTTVHVGDAMRTPDGGSHIFTAAHHDALARFADATGDRYLSCGRRTVRFTSYVGFLQLGNLGIEVLPKADRREPGAHGRWHRALVHMLRAVGDLGLEAPDEARLQLDPGRLFDLFISRFLDECARLLHEGLAKGYRTEEGNTSAFRGRLVVTEQVRHNAANAARFYVAAPVYDHDNLPNLALLEALRIVERLPVASGSSPARAVCAWASPICRVGTPIARRLRAIASAATPRGTDPRFGLQRSSCSSSRPI